MAGDKVQINTFAYYNGATQTPVSDKHPGWAGSVGEAYNNFAKTSSSGGAQGYNYLNSKFSGGYSNKSFRGDVEFYAGTGENYYFAGYGDIFDFDAIREGYALQQKSVNEGSGLENANHINDGLVVWDRAWDIHLHHLD